MLLFVALGILAIFNSQWLDVAITNTTVVKSKLMQRMEQMILPLKIDTADSIRIVKRVRSVPTYGWDIVSVPGFDQYLITDRERFDIHMYQDDTFVHAINLEIEGRELFVYGNHVGLWDVVFDPEFDGASNKYIYISLGTASSELFGPNNERIGIHSIVKAQYDPFTMEIRHLDSGGQLRTPRNMCQDCHGFSWRKLPVNKTHGPYFDYPPPALPALPAEDVVFDSSRNPQYYIAREQYRNNATNNTLFLETSAGGKLLFLPDQTLLFSIGYIHQQLISQDLQEFDGKIIRLTKQGEPVCDIDGITDNPFCDSVHPVTRYIYSYGHKNNQGLAYDATNGRIFASEHGEQGGDELNVVYSGQNYGFPYFATGGTPYIGTTFGDVYPAPDGLLRQHTVQPLFVWNYRAQSTAVAGLAYINEPVSHPFKNNLLVAKLAGVGIDRIAIDGNGNPLLIEELMAGHRFRDIEIDSNGRILMLADRYRMLYIAEAISDNR